MSNRVHELQERLEDAYEARLTRGRSQPFAQLVARQEDVYEALTKRRQQIGLTLAEANDLASLAERHLTKIEPLRNGWKPYLRQCITMAITKTLWALFGLYGLCLLIVDESNADELLERAAAPPVKLTVSQRRRLGIPGEQMELPLPHPVRMRVSVAQVEEAVRSRKVRAGLELAA